MASETGIVGKSEAKNEKKIGQYVKKGGNVDVGNDIPNLVEPEDVPEEPKTFKEAWDHPDKKERELWREAIKKEFGDMSNRKV